MTEPLIELSNVTVALNGTTVLHGINWQLYAGEHWAIIGSNGSGKSTFLRLIRGDLWPVPGKGERIYRIGPVERNTALAARKRISLVSPELQDRYLQREWRLTGLQVLYSGFSNADYPYTRPTAEQKRFTEEVIDLLRIDQLQHRNVQQLSTGELRKLLIARALMARPAIVALDEVSDGLDAPSRKELLEILCQLPQTGTQLISATHRQEEIVPCITHILQLEEGHVVDNRRSAGLLIRGNVLVSHASQRGMGNRSALVSRSKRKRRSSSKTTLLRLQQANVFLERKLVLRNINWEIRAGQHWAVLGANGAGKSTLLKLAFGDLQPAWGGKISRFNFSAGSALWKIKKKIGYISPELQARYHRPVTGSDVVGSGFYSSVGVHQNLSKRQKKRVGELIDAFAAMGLAGKTADQMSYGELAKILLLRALVHGPELLICDEPFSGLDAAARQEFSAAMGTAARAGTSLLVATHYVGDLPERMTHGLLLRNGQVVIQGSLEEVRAHPATQRLFGAL